MRLIAQAILAKGDILQFLLVSQLIHVFLALRVLLPVGSSSIVLARLLGLNLSWPGELLAEIGVIHDER